jgi:hypothetical protein
MGRAASLARTPSFRGDTAALTRQRTEDSQNRSGRELGGTLRYGRGSSMPPDGHQDPWHVSPHQNAWDAFRLRLREFLECRISSDAIRAGVLVQAVLGDDAPRLKLAGIDAFLDAAARTLVDIAKPWALESLAELPAFGGVLDCAYALVEDVDVPPAGRHDRVERGRPRVVQADTRSGGCCPLGLSERAVRDLVEQGKGTSRAPLARITMPLLLVDHLGQGRLGKITVEAVASGTGQHFAAPSQALDWVSPDFLGSLEEAFHWAKLRFEFSSVDLRWHVAIPGWCDRLKLRGNSGGAAFAFAFARLLAHCPGAIPALGFGVAQHVRNIDCDRIILSAGIDRGGRLYPVGGLAGKLGPVLMTLLPRGVDTLVVAYEQDTSELRPRQLLLQRYVTLDQAATELSTLSRRRALEIVLLWLGPALALAIWVDPGIALMHRGVVMVALLAVLAAALAYALSRLPAYPTAAIRSSANRALLSTHGLFMLLGVLFAACSGWYFSYLAPWSFVPSIGVVILGVTLFGRGREHRKSLGGWVACALASFAPGALVSFAPGVLPGEFGPLHWIAVRHVELRRAPLRGLALQGLHAASGARLNLSAANLEGANLEGADLTDALLTEAKLSGARLDRAILVGADLRETCASTASFPGADLRRASLSGLDLSGANASTAVGLAQPLLEEAMGDALTRLPSGLRVHCAGCVVGQGPVPYAPDCRDCPPPAFGPCLGEND